MPKILQLSPHVADLIAAGEVVERPASVVKELTENSVDAGAKHVTVEIQNGGMTFIRVTDDGCGMAPEDAETAFLRHATSKIRSAEDLSSIRTLGFRGEALAAAAAVSRIELMTKTQDAGLGVSLRLEAGQVTNREEVGCPDGTTLIVRDLFYNTPARMKFMKRDSVEASHVLGVLQKQALSHPEVSFRYIRDGVEELSTTGDGDLYSAIYAVFGRQLANDMVKVDGKWENCRLTGFVTKPTCTRGNRNYQQFFVNGRYIKSRLLGAALEEAYRNQIMVGRFPGCVLMLTVPETDVDVNVHPAKNEVKFISEQTVFDCVRYGVTSALNQTPAKPAVTLPKAAPAPASPKAAPVSAAPKQGGFHTMTAEDYKVFRQALEQQKPVTVSESVTRAVFEKKPEPVETVPVAEQIRIPMPAPKPKAPEPPAPVVLTEEKPKEAASYRIVGEVLDTYIIVEQEQTVLFIDKHAAHERILFEKLKQQPVEVMSQTLLVPITAALTPEESSAVLENLPLLSKCGFDVEDFGDGSVLIRRLPAGVSPDGGERMLQHLAGDLLEGKRLSPDDLHDKLLHTVACKAAIKAGWHTNPREIEALTAEVMGREELKYCPHGRPICITLTEKELEKYFKR